MHDEFEHLESELKQLRPRPTSPMLVERISHDLGSAQVRTHSGVYSSATTWRSWKWAVWPAAAAALVAVVMAIIARWNSVPASSQRKTMVATAASAPVSALQSTDIYKPVQADNLLASRDEERITLADGTPARRLRAQYVDTITWKNPQTNASLRWSVPREEVRIVPVSFQ